MLQFTNGFGSIGMLIFAPLSEIYGRARPMFLGLFFFLVLQAPIALAQNLPAIFICRFLTGAAGFSIIAIFPAMTVDLFSSSDRGPAVDLYVLAFNTGPCFGSLAGGFLVDRLLLHRFPRHLRNVRSSSPPAQSRASPFRDEELGHAQQCGRTPNHVEDDEAEIHAQTCHDAVSRSYRRLS
jgi:MFS family permease